MAINAYGGEGADREEGGSPFGTQLLVDFSLCPSGSSTCSGGGEYITELRDFVETYTQAKEEIQEQKCANVEENCNCEYYYGDDEACMSQCYAKAGYDFCGEQENQNEFDVNEYMECREAEFGNYYNQYYIGPVCSSNGKAIHLKLFTDARCTTAAPSGTYEKYNYNYALPYSKASLISNDRLSCKDEEEQNNNQNANQYGYNKYYQQPEPTEFCQELYEQSAKCETNLKYKSSGYSDTSSCQYIHKILPALQNVHSSNGGGGAATFFAVFFALTTFGACAAAYYFYNKVTRTTVDLSAQEGDATFA